MPREPERTDPERTDPVDLTAGADLTLGADLPPDEIARGADERLPTEGAREGE
ncbi:MAG TPA: hypothetical protein VMT52_03110 [Planctomycetota bacterium]|nr:hypothetical protein [Planctomycetota bacterium]